MTQPAEPLTDPVDPDEQVTEQTTDDEHQGDETIVYKRADLEKLRTEAKDNRVRAEAAEAATEELSRQLFAAKVSALGKLADPTDLEYSADLLDDDALNAAVDELLTRRPHYAARKVSGTVGQGITGQQEQPFSMMGRLQQSA